MPEINRAIRTYENTVIHKLFNVSAHNTETVERPKFNKKLDVAWDQARLGEVCMVGEERPSLGTLSLCHDLCKILFSSVGC